MAVALAVETGVGLILDPELALAARHLVAAIHDQDWLAAVPARAEQLAESHFERGRLAAELEHVLRTERGTVR